MSVLIKMVKPDYGVLCRRRRIGRGKPGKRMCWQKLELFKKDLKHIQKLRHGQAKRIYGNNRRMKIKLESGMTIYTGYHLRS